MIAIAFILKKMWLHLKHKGVPMDPRLFGMLCPAEIRRKPDDAHETLVLLMRKQTQLLERFIVKATAYVKALGGDGLVWWCNRQEVNDAIFKKVWDLRSVVRASRTIDKAVWELTRMPITGVVELWTAAERKSIVRRLTLMLQREYSHGGLRDIRFLHRPTGRVVPCIERSGIYMYRCGPNYVRVLEDEEELSDRASSKPYVRMPAKKIADALLFGNKPEKR